MLARLGTLTPVASAAAPTTGPANATVAHDSERIQSIADKLSIATLRVVQPIRIPDTSAMTATSNQCRLDGAGCRLDAAMAAANTSAANAIPPAACQRQF